MKNRSTNSNNSNSATLEFLSSWWVFMGCCVFRMANAWCIQSQFDPDEYWQTLEVAYCRVFGNCNLTWEWTGSLPIRSYASILPTWAFYKLLQYTGQDSYSFIQKGPSLLHATLFAGPTDWLIARLAVASSSTSRGGTWALLCSLTSWFHAYCLVRTYTNSIECFLITLVTALIVIPDRKQQNNNNNNNNNNPLAYVLMGVTVAGVRFTSLAAFLPLFLYDVRQQPNRISYLLCSCTYGLIGILLCFAIDRYFYGFWTMVSINNFYINIVRNYSSLYGTHPFYWYFLVGIPVIAGTTILPIPLLHLYSQSTTFTTNHKLFGILVLSYLLLHSLSAHKEFRFILPVSPFLCIVTGHLLEQQQGRNRRRKRNLLFALLTIINFGIWFYLSRIHQQAPIQVNRLIVSHIEEGSNASTTIHFLTGCHAAPIYSHLHIHRPIQVRTLDCSPACRLSEQLQQLPICESSLFLSNPQSFVESFYGLSSSSSTENPICSISTNQSRPDFIAIYQNEARAVHELLVNQMGMILLHRIPNGIRHVQVKFPRIKIDHDFMYLYQKQ
jgi:phosphatidylinositol glycan class B